MPLQPPHPLRKPLVRRTALVLGAAILASALIAANTSGALRVTALAAVGSAGFVAWLAAVTRLLNRRTGPSLPADTQALSRVEKLATTGRLAAGIAHEVGNPLSAIANYAHLVRQRAGGAPPIDEPLDALEREVERIDRIVRGLLDYARPRRLTPKAVRVDDVLEGVLRLMSDQGVLRRVEVQRHIEAADAAVYAERHDLEQVFVNLLLNAVDAMGGVGRLGLRMRVVSAGIFRDVVLRRSTDATDERFPRTPSGRALGWLARHDRAETVLQVVVADSGPGVPPGDEERVFEPFFSTKGEGRGTGLGLAIVAQTIESLGGTIWVQPAREGGAAFVLLLPLHAAME